MSSTGNNIVKDLLAKYRNGNISKEELELLFSWIEKGSISRELLADMEETFPLHQQEVPFNDLITHRMRKRLLEAVTDRQDLPPVKSRRGLKPMLKWVAASMLLVGALIGLYPYLFKAEAVFVTYTTKAGEHSRLILPDSSVVYLNGQTSLKYPKIFATNERSVELKGEAFFDVKKDERRPFHIASNCFTTRVLGTSFNIDTEIDSSITVLTGKVKVDRVNQAGSIYLEADQKAVWDSRQGKWVSEKQADGSDWMSGKLHFSQQPLQLVVKGLSRYYGVSIAVPTPIQDKRISIAVDNKALHAVLKTIADITDTELNRTPEGGWSLTIN